MSSRLSPHERLRSMYPDGRARRYARRWSRVFAVGLLPRRWVTLEVAGRRSGQVTRFPLGIADYDGHWYLVPMLGERCNWVRNVRAAGGRATPRRRGAMACQLVELPVGERARSSGGTCRRCEAADPTFELIGMRRRTSLRLLPLVTRCSGSYRAIRPG
jgi:hypothetical protein